MRIIIMSNDPTARVVFDLARREQAVRVLDYRMQQAGTWRPTGLHYSLGQRYTRLHHHHTIPATLKQILRWTHADLPLIVITRDATDADRLRAAIRSDYPLTQIVEGTPCQA